MLCLELSQGFYSQLACEPTLRGGSGAWATTLFDEVTELGYEVSYRLFVQAPIADARASSTPANFPPGWPASPGSDDPVRVAAGLRLGASRQVRGCRGRLPDPTGTRSKARTRAARTSDHLIRL